MIATAQTFGDLVHWHPHVHTIVAAGIFTESGHFVYIPDIWKHKAEEFFAERVFTFLLKKHKINDEIAGNMRSWKYSSFSVDNSVCVEHGDKAGMQRLIQYIVRCPFSLTSMVSLNKDGKILYRAS
ncbi:MAG TPA: transposase, partial [Chitinispirillaceae bacterium]|nr:transposase [Chitinispirillaceae bacterium]